MEADNKELYLELFEKILKTYKKMENEDKDFFIVELDQIWRSLTPSEKKIVNKICINLLKKYNHEE